MLSSIRVAMVLVFVAFPLVEIAVLIKVGQVLGVWPTITLLIAAAILGFFVIREQGLSMVSRAIAAMNAGKAPIGPVLDSYVQILAGMLLIIPGLVTDLVGLILLVPPVRRATIRWGLSRMFGGMRDPDRSQKTKNGDTIVIEGTYERLDDDPDKPQRDI